jgi:hypothetical protein
LKQILAFRNGEMTDITEERQKLPVSVTPAVWRDIKPYEFMGESHKSDHEIVTSRTRHKELLREGGYVEIGNEKPKALRGV